MDSIPQPRPRGLATACIPGCVADHGEELGAFYCYTAPESVVAGTARTGVFGMVEVGTDRCVGYAPGDPVATPHQVTVEVPDRMLSLTPSAARELGWMLIGRADLAERCS